jgi:hypothetical protein
LAQKYLAQVRKNIEARSKVSAVKLGLQRALALKMEEAEEQKKNKKYKNFSNLKHNPDQISKSKT